MQLNPARGRKRPIFDQIKDDLWGGFMQLNPARGRKLDYKYTATANTH